MPLVFYKHGPPTEAGARCADGKMPKLQSRRLDSLRHMGGRILTPSVASATITLLRGFCHVSARQPFNLSQFI
jgi:hypothetical protein